MSFWCERCNDWLPLDEGAAEEQRAVCLCCGDDFQCQECGYEIDLDGNCQRKFSGPAEIVGVCPGGKEAARD